MKIRPESGVNELTSANLSGKALEKKEADAAKSIKDTVEVKDKASESSGLLNKAKAWVKTNIAGETKLSETSRSKVDADYGDKEALMVGIGAAGGAAVGTAVGVAAGIAESNVTSKEWVPHNIEDKKLVGYNHYVQENVHYDEDEGWVVDGYWHRFVPDIDFKKVGEYQTPEYKHSSWLNPLTGGLVGLVGGTVVGGALGFVVSVINKAVHERGN